jgi:ribonuclease HII
MLLPFHEANRLEAGVDEAGRGCYAGPVFAAAVILPPDFHHPLLNDSKQLTEKQRELLRPIIEQESIAWAVAQTPETIIDEINILQATYQAMHNAIAALRSRPDALLIDGNRFKPYPGIPHQCFVKGDGRYASIAAASILAKTHRDACMLELHAQFPQYGWHQNKGYGTAQHREAIEQHGICVAHRKSFRIVPAQTNLF